MHLLKKIYICPVFWFFLLIRWIKILRIFFRNESCSVIFKPSYVIMASCRSALCFLSMCYNWHPEMPPVTLNTCYSWKYLFLNVYPSLYHWWMNELHCFVCVYHGVSRETYNIHVNSILFFLYLKFFISFYCIATTLDMSNHVNNSKYLCSDLSLQRHNIVFCSPAGTVSQCEHIARHGPQELIVNYPVILLNLPRGHCNSLTPIIATSVEAQIFVIAVCF